MKLLSILLLLAFMDPVAVWARGVPLPSPDAAKGAIAVTLRGKPPMGPKVSAVQVYFVRLDEGNDFLEADRVIFSNFSGKRQVYLLNCDPGRYLVVGAELSSRGTGMDYKVFLDRETIAQTEVVVEPGEISFLGVAIIDLRVKIDQADDAQAHFLELLEPEVASRGYMARAFSGAALYLGSLVDLDRSPETERDFLTTASEKVFRKHPEWRRVVEGLLASARGL